MKATSPNRADPPWIDPRRQARCSDTMRKRFFNRATLPKAISVTIVFLGIDLAKSVFALHGVDGGGKPALVRPTVLRDPLLERVASGMRG